MAIRFQYGGPSGTGIGGVGGAIANAKLQGRLIQAQQPTFESMFGDALGRGFSGGIIEAFARKREDEILARKQAYDMAGMREEYRLRGELDQASDQRGADAAINRLMLQRRFEQEDQFRAEREAVDSAFFEVNPDEIGPAALAEYNDIMGETTAFYQSPMMKYGAVPLPVQQDFERGIVDRKKRLLQKIKPKTPQEQFQQETFQAPNGAVYGRDRSGAWREVTKAPDPVSPPTIAANHPLWQQAVQAGEVPDWLPVDGNGKPLISVPRATPSKDKDYISEATKLAGQDATADEVLSIADKLKDREAQVGERKGEREALRQLMKDEPQNADFYNFINKQVLDRSKSEDVPPEVILQKEIDALKSVPPGQRTPQMAQRGMALERLKAIYDAN